MLLSHEQQDYFDLSGLQRLARLDPVIVAPKSCHPKLWEIGYPDQRIAEARCGETRDWGTFSVQVVPNFMIQGMSCDLSSQKFRDLFSDLPVIENSYIELLTKPGLGA